MPEWATGDEFSSVTCTRDELSIVVSDSNLSEEWKAGPVWICFKLEGPFPFCQTGVLLSFVSPLSNNGVPIFSISTYDTDYVLVQQEDETRALQLLREAGHHLLF
jgi:uncharacterized protein